MIMTPLQMTGGALPGAACASLLALLLSNAAHAADTNASPSWKLSGFGTLGVVHSTERHADFVASPLKGHGAGATRSVSPHVDSKIGGQLDLTLDPNWSAVMQVVSDQRMDASYKPRLEWANIKYQATPELALRLGRIALPMFIAAEYRKVGYAYPWVRTPVEVYGGLPFTNSDGIDVTWQWNGESFRSNTQAFWGHTDIPLYDGARLRATGISGLSHTVESGAFSARASVLNARLTMTLFPEFFDAIRAFGPQGMAIADNLQTRNKQATAISVGASYDPGKWFLMSEAGYTKVDAHPGRMKSVYASGGYRQGDFTPYLGWSRVWGKRPEGPTMIDLRGLPPVYAAAGAVGNGYLDIMLNAIATQSSVTTGLRWDFASNVALKLQYDRVTPRSGSRGTMNNRQPEFRAGQTAHVTSVALDFVF